MTLAQLRSAVKSQGGIDATDAEVDAAVNDRLGVMVAEAKWRMAEVVVGTTVAGQANYSLDDSIVDLKRVRIGQAEYAPAGQTEVWGLKSGRLWLSAGFGEAGVFAPDWTSSGAAQVELYPAPAEDGETIYGLAALKPDTLAADGDVPGIPSDLHDPLADGTVAVFLRRLDERPDLAQVFEDRFQAGIVKLSRRRKSRVGSGPLQIRVAR